MIPPPATFGPHDLSAICSGTRNLWGTLSHHHHQHHHSQSPHNLSTPSSTTRTPWNSDHHCHPCFYPLHPPPHFNPLPNPMLIHVVETVCHPKGIAPTKPVVHTTCPIHHNMLPAPVQFIKTTHHPQEMRTPNGHPPRPPPPLTHSMFAVQHHFTGLTGMRPLLGCSHIWPMAPMPTLEP